MSVKIFSVAHLMGRISQIIDSASPSNPNSHPIAIGPFEGRERLIDGLETFQWEKIFPPSHSLSPSSLGS